MPKVPQQADGDTTLVRLGDAIRARRLALQMSQEALADAAQINRTHMGEVERGRRNVSFLAIVRIARAVELTPSQIMEAAGL